MATATQILDRACRITGLRTTGSERALALQALQDAYIRSVLDSECSLSSTTYNIPSVADSYSLTTITTTAPMRLYYVGISSNGQNYPLQQVSYAELLERRELDSLPGSPTIYATVGFESIAMYPNPSTSDTLTVVWVPMVPTLTEGTPGAGEEASPSKLPVAFHWSVLLPSTVLEMLDKDQRAEESALWHQRYVDGIARLQEHIGQMGGQANRAWLARGSSRSPYNDQRGRW